MRHDMKLVDSAFASIANGTKTIELRLYDEKRQAIHVGDTIVFRSTDTDDAVCCDVIALHTFKDFEELYRALPLNKCGYADVTAAKPTDMLAYYTAEQIEAHGVVGIELDNVRRVNRVAWHYDSLIDQGNDPVHDPEPLRLYMERWDGAVFIDKLGLADNKTVLEIGVGTGRLARKTAPRCGAFYGIDISPKTVCRAEDNLASFKNIALICGDFSEYHFETTFDIVYSSLTFMHIEDKRKAVRKVFDLLSDGGVFVLSIDKNQDAFIDIGTSKIRIFPDTPEAIGSCLHAAGFHIAERLETEFAHIFVAKKYTVCYCGHDCSP